MHRQEPIYLRGLRDAIDLIRSRLGAANLVPADHERIITFLNPVLDDIEASIREHQVILTTSYLVAPAARRTRPSLALEDESAHAELRV